MTKPNLRNLGFVLFCLITFNVQTLKGQILETLHSFSFSDGSGPTTLLEGTDGNIYGTTSSGISGAIFRMNFTGSLSNLAFFERYTTGDGRKALIEGADGNFYGAANDGGSNLIGTIFKMTSEGALTTLHTFSFNESIARPTGALVQGVDGIYLAMLLTVFLKYQPMKA